jgi:uncharacterized protein DUF1629
MAQKPQYFEMTFELAIEGKWYLAHVVGEDGKEILGGKFWKGIYFESSQRITVIPNVFGRPVDYTQTAFGVPIVSSVLADVVQSFGPETIQRIPAVVDVFKTGYEILNILTVLECVDLERTIVERYTEHHGSPSKVGQIHTLMNIALVPERVEGHHIFRLAELKLIIIVSEKLKVALEEHGFTGLKFIPVS